MNLLKVKQMLKLFILGLFAAGCNQSDSPPQQPTLEQVHTISDLTPEDLAQLETQRSVLEKYLGDETSKENYKTPAGKLGLLRALLEQKVFKANQTYELQCMGIVFGDALVQELEMTWVMVEDEYGRDPAIRLGDTSIIMYPLTMISKRVEDGEEVDVFELFNSSVMKVEELRNVVD